MLSLSHYNSTSHSSEAGEGRYGCILLDRQQHLRYHCRPGTVLAAVHRRVPGVHWSIGRQFAVLCIDITRHCFYSVDCIEMASMVTHTTYWYFSISSVCCLYWGAVGSCILELVLEINMILKKLKKNRHYKKKKILKLLFFV